MNVNDILDVESDELNEQIAKMRDQVIDALLDGYPALSRLQCARRHMGKKDELFIVLDALPPVIRNAFTRDFDHAACLIETRWMVAPHADWENWVARLKTGAGNH